MHPIQLPLDDGVAEFGVHRRMGWGLRRWTACCSVYLSVGDDEGSFHYHKPAWTREAAVEMAYEMYRGLVSLGDGDD